MPQAKIGVIGGSGLIGKKLVPILRQRGHEAVSASPSSGVNALTGEVLRRNLLVYGVGGLIVPFVGIKLIDVLLVALRLV